MILALSPASARSPWLCRCLVFACLACCLSGCASFSSLLAGPKGAVNAKAEADWETFLSRLAPQNATIQAFSCQASLNYAGPKAQNRVLIRFWGNPDEALRLDLMAGIGAALSYWREGQDGFTAYVPDRNMAYVHADSRQGMAAFGVPLPYTLRELGMLLNGHWSTLVPRRYRSVRQVNLAGEAGFEYQLQDKDGRDFTLILDAHARPVRLTGPGDPPWEISFSGSLEDQGLAELPKKIVMQRADSEKVVIYIKKIERQANAWPAKSLELTLPPGTVLKRLR